MIWYSTGTGGTGSTWTTTNCTASTTTTTYPVWITTTATTTASTASLVFWSPDNPTTAGTWTTDSTWITPSVYPSIYAPNPPRTILREVTPVITPEMRRRHRILRRRKVFVGNRARQLLLDHLTDDQRLSLERNGWFIVIGGHSRRRYKIIAANDNFAGNIHVLDGERTVARLCGHCDHTIPFNDQILAQKLMLENAEEDFLKLANRQAA